MCSINDTHDAVYSPFFRVCLHPPKNYYSHFVLTNQNHCYMLKLNDKSLTSKLAAPFRINKSWSSALQRRYVVFLSKNVYFFKHPMPLSRAPPSDENVWHRESSDRWRFVCITKQFQPQIPIGVILNMSST